jgi:hypothetical protein
MSCSQNEEHSSLDRFTPVSIIEKGQAVIVVTDCDTDCTVDLKHHQAASSTRDISNK